MPRPFRARARRAAAALLVLAATMAAGPHASAADPRYVLGGTVVVREEGRTVVDEGTMICDNGSGTGGGGVCLPFGGGDAVGLVDDVAGEDVAFQVCIDNSGDGVCTSPDTSGACADYVEFSHGDDGSFHNPVGPVPTGFTPGCPGGPWQGYVVFVCEGVHTAGGAHEHPGTTGSGYVAGGTGEGDGEFCGGSFTFPTSKRYVVAPDANTVYGAFEPAACRLVAATGPGVPGLVDVDAEGDTFVAGERVYDCPPYGD